MNIINTFFLELLLQLHVLTGSLGWAILAFTFLIRFLLVPLSLPSIRSQKVMKTIQPEVLELKKKHKGDKKAFQMAQIELYKKYNVNPLVGCLPQLVQIALLIILYNVLVSFVSKTEINGVALNTTFFWLNLAQPDSLYILPILAAVTQLFLSLMILPGGEVKDEVPNNSRLKKVQKENEKEEDVAEMAASMQKQMLFMMPVMTGFIAVGFPSGLALYWVASTVFSIGQQYFTTGLGGVVLYAQRTRDFLKEKLR